MTWQPISTAPRDGTEILVWGCVGQDIERAHIWAVVIAEWDDWPHKPAWRWSDGMEEVVPTHWMPLPAPPVTTTEAERIAVMEGK